MSNIYVFDMGNVVLKPSNLRMMYDECEIKCDYKTFKTLFYESKEAYDVYSGLIDDNTFFEIIKDKCKINKSIYELKELYLRYKGNIYEDTLNFIYKLKNSKNKICLLSNIKEIDYAYLRSVIDINLFDKTFLSYLIGYAKPDKEIFEYVIKELGTNDFNFFDDSIENVNSAKRLGINAYQTTGENIKKLNLKI